VSAAAARIALIAFLALAPACGTSGTASPDAGALTDGSPAADAPFIEKSTTHPAFTPPVPQVLKGSGTPLAAPRLVPVFFPGHPYEAKLKDFLARFAASSTWTAMVGEYGVGAPTVANAVDVGTSPAAMLSQAEVVNWLASQLDGTHPEWGPTDAATLASTVYLLYYPDGTTIGLGPQGFPSCTTFAGYHDDAPISGGRDVQYAVLPLCTMRLPTAFDALTATTSHELAEAATDPRPTTDGAYGDVDPAFIAWSISGFGGEVGDMCEARTSSFFFPADVGYRVQREWSNAAARAYHDPCAPVPPGDPPYFAAAPVATDAVDVLYGGAHYAARGVTVPVGQTKTVEVDLFSDAPTSMPWSVAAYETLIASDGSILPRELELSFDAQSGGNGDVLHLSITANGATALGASFVRIDSRLGSATQSWFLTVGTP
jgi:hypothetical protein